MEIDLLKIIKDAKTIYCTYRNIESIYSAIRWSIIDYRWKYLPDTKCSYISRVEDRIKQISPYDEEHWWQLCDVESKLKRFNEYIEYFKRPENRYLKVEYNEN